MPAPQRPRSDRNKPQHLINERIRYPEVRIVGDDIESTVMPTRQALRLAREKGVDLVEIAPTADPPVCRLINYSKFLYQQKKRQRELKAKQTKIEVKEIRFGPQTDDHDYNFKLKHAKEFLSDGNKVKAYVYFRGRAIVFKDQGEVLLLKFATDLEEYGKVEHMPTLEGKKMNMILAPKKTNASKKAATTTEVAEEASNEAAKAKKAPQVKAKKEYLGPKVEGEDF